MNFTLLYDQQPITLEAPRLDIYETQYPLKVEPARKIVSEAMAAPLGTKPFREIVQTRRSDEVVIVVSDITRPIPYRTFLDSMLDILNSEGVEDQSIILLIATGMHRPSNLRERETILGRSLARRFARNIIDHDATHSELTALQGKSCSGSRIRLNRLFVQAGLRIVTGLVEPHFMAGFSGGRKAVCPGLVSLDSIYHFHGYAYLANPAARNGNLLNNVCHEEALSIARSAGVDFSLNVVLNKARKVVKAFAGDVEAAHLAACEYVLTQACPLAEREYDVVITSCGGYPLDSTFYQCVKGIVSCLPLVRRNGIVLAVGGCTEGIGSQKYAEIMEQYADDWQSFLADIARQKTVKQDQWQFQMHTRALTKVGPDNIWFVTESISPEVLDKLQVRGVACPKGEAASTVQRLIDEFVKQGKSLAAIPEGPYCAPVELTS